MIKICKKCRAWALRGEEVCFWHSDSERAEKIAKRVRDKHKDTSLSLNDFLKDLLWMRRRIKHDPLTLEIQRLKVLTKLDLRILKLQKMIKKEQPEKNKKKLVTGSQLIQRESSGKIIRKVVTS